jgi:hypothetical protein
LPIASTFPLRPDILIIQQESNYMRRCIIIAFICLVAGCSSRLETGYAPRKLGATEVERRAFYAQPFTREAREGETARMEELKSRRPTDY